MADDPYDGTVLMDNDHDTEGPYDGELTVSCPQADDPYHPLL